MRAIVGKNLLLTCLLAVLVTFMGGCGNAAEKTSENSGMKTKRIVLIGASVGKEWHLAEFNKRTGSAAGDYDYESIAVYQYDKTEAIKEVLMRPKRKFKLTKSYFLGLLAPSPVPADIIILKECAAYFPGEIESYKKLMSSWVEMIKSAGKGVMVATVVPVTREHANGRPGRIEAILDYNDWIREYAKKANIALLDLEASLRKSDSERILREELSSDGLHLNKDGYAILDRLLADTCATKL